MSKDECTLCAAALGQKFAIDVCGKCHEALVATGHVSLTSTTEFDQEEVQRALSETHTGRPRRETGEDNQECAWCAKQVSEVSRMFQQAGVSICSECIAFCQKILVSE